MNIAFFLTLKKDTAYLYDDYTLRQALEKMRAHGYTQIPVISRSGEYIGVVTEGDFLWYMIDSGGVSMHNAEDLLLKDVLSRERARPFYSAKITADIEELVALALNQNFVPVADDDGIYIGIVTRRSILKQLVASRFPKPPLKG